MSLFSELLWCGAIGLCAWLGCACLVIAGLLLLFECVDKDVPWRWL